MSKRRLRLLAWQGEPIDDIDASQGDDFDDDIELTPRCDFHNDQYLCSSSSSSWWKSGLSILVRPVTVFLRLRSRGPAYAAYAPLHSYPRSSVVRSVLVATWWFIRILLLALLTIVCITGIFFPSYSSPPPHYELLSRRMASSALPGRGNPNQEKIFIAASIYDSKGSLASGRWGQSILQLIDLLGRDNVYLSIYENNSGEEGSYALRQFAHQVPCNKSIVYESQIDMDLIDQTVFPDGSSYYKRIAYLAEVRNRALEPLDRTDTKYDKVLMLNDVIFTPEDAVQLLFSTNTGRSVGRPKGQDAAAEDARYPHNASMAKFPSTTYSAACGVDFINIFKFYDTYATRDLEGFSMGLPLFPWFSGEGRGMSRNDVLKQKDAVRVKSCWGGIAAFDAQYFQTLSDDLRPVKFRSDLEPFWDSSECCLVHADILEHPVHRSKATELDKGHDHEDFGIYMNPFVRVAYDPWTKSTLKFARRFEILFFVFQDIITRATKMPWYNPRRTEMPGQAVSDYRAVAEVHGTRVDYHRQEYERIAGIGGYCGRYGSSILTLNRTNHGKTWKSLKTPVEILKYRPELR